MSIIVKGMEMPKNCDECPCYYETEGAWRNECEVLGKEYIADDYRPEWCPLVELPPHGRLIDADALNDMINRSYPMTDRVDVHNGYAICQEMIKQLPTIIEADDTIKTPLFDIVEEHDHCHVQVLRNSITGEVSVGWWEEKE